MPPEWGLHQSADKITISHITTGTIPRIDKALIIDKEQVKIVINNICRSSPGNFTVLNDIVNKIKFLEDIKLCNGSGIANRVSRYCNGENLRRNTKRCHSCAKLRKNILKNDTRFHKLNRKLQLQKKQAKTKCVRLQKKLSNNNQVIINLQNKMANTTNIDEIISNLSENQQLVVKTCFEAAKYKPKGRRYSKDWIYSCLLMKIKSPKLYRHLRTRELLPLPAPSTISKYIRNLDSSYGFQPKLFELIKEKCNYMPEYERHGTLMVDECKITPSKHFDKNRLQVMGFVDLGDYTPHDQKNALGDHALVLMFQSFSGKNMQAIACFLSKGNVSGSVQAKIILEGTALCENAGLFIDVVTSDGATWNRSMWKHLSAGDPEAPWCTHPCSDDRRLRMCSDFLHILKCIRNRLVAKKELHVPEGRVLLAHFEKLIEYDAKHEFKLAPKLTRKHINPQNHEKMTTRFAFQLFSNTVADALTLLKDKKIPGFSDCEATIQFCIRINNLSDILNSNSPLTALRPNSLQQQALEDFLIYMDLWESCSDPIFFLSRSTADGLKATINTVLDLLKYCTTSLNFKYLMTARINQDPLEHFFGLLRDCGGCNNNPESFQIAQIFKLVSLYSLVKPPKGSNVAGGSMLNALVNNTSDLWDLDSILNENSDAVCDVAFSDNEEAFAYVCGYIARKHAECLY